jgi:hypothetical protein
MENARELLDAAGLSFPHVVSARVFLTDGKDFAEFNRVYREYVGADRPARATVVAALTSPAYNVEITFVASAAARQAIETARCLEEGVLEHVHDGNIGSIFGIGFPAWAGGALQYVNHVGTKKFVKRADELAKKVGPRFAPPKLLRDLAAKNKPLA